MTARCTHCKRVWIVSIRTSPAGYVCPNCEYRERMVAAGVIRPVEAGRRESKNNCTCHLRIFQPN